jgi:hypothetical protein
MSFLSDIGNIVSKAVEIVAPIALASVFPPAALMPGVGNMVASMVGQGLSDAIGQLGKQGGLPSFVANKAQDLLGKIVSQLLQPVDKGCADHVHDKCGGAFGGLVERMLKDFKDAFSNYQNEQAKNGKGCGKGGSTGGAGGNAPIGFRELAQILAQLEEKQAKNVRTAVQDASKALGIDKKEDGAEAKQFEALEASKAEAQLMQMVTSMVSEVLSKFGQGLNTAANAK